MSEFTIRRARVTDIILLASQLSGLNPKVITGRARDAAVMRVRQAVYTIARENGHSYPMIGRVMGNRDHSTIINGCARHLAHYERNAEYAGFVDRLRAESEAALPFVEVVPPQLVPVSAPAPVPKQKPKNDFSPRSEPQDSGHLFHKGVSRGSDRLLAALRGAA